MTHVITSFLSFDVEALPGRANGEPLEQLIWGRIDGGEYGIARICQVLDEHQVRGNFLIDFSACLLYGDDKVAPVIDYIQSRGHEVHAHLHSEWVTRHWELPNSRETALGMDRAGPKLSDALLTFTAHKCQKLLGRVPSVFRSGAFLFNESTVRAAKRCGFAVLSNFDVTRLEGWPLPAVTATNEPFLWENGILELPVNFSPEPLEFDWQIYENWLGRVQLRKKEKTNNLVMHSWSLLVREEERFIRFNPAHEEQLHRICDRVKRDGPVLTYDEYLRGREEPTASTPTVAPNICPALVVATAEPAASCNICGQVFLKPPTTDVCPSCASRARHRQVQDVIRRIGNPFDGKAVLATFANATEKSAFLSGVASLVNFDIRPVSEADIQMDVQDMRAIHDEQFDAFLSLHVLNHVKDDARAVSEIHRVLRPGGLALITLPYREGAATTPLDDVTIHYGKDAFDKYGVGSYRRYGLEDAISMFAKYFDMRLESGLDPVTRDAMYAFLLRKPHTVRAVAATLA